MFTLCKPVCCMLAAGLLLLASAALAGEDPFGASTENPFGTSAEDPFSPAAESEETQASEVKKKDAEKRGAEKQNETDPELEQIRSSLADAERESERREMKIRLALQESTEVDYFRTPLNEVARFLSDYHEVPILLDENALTDMGLGSDTPLTSTVKGISLDSALRQLLREVELSHVITDEVLLITTEQQARRLNDPAVYDVAGLASDAESLERLAKTIDAVLGGDATVVAVNGQLIVAGTLGEQQRAKRLVEKLRGKPQKE